MSDTQHRPPGLPRGTILDPNGKPCKVCIPWQTWKNLVKQADQPSSSPAKTTHDAPPPVSRKPSAPAAPRLPPGIVLDENGKPCKVCNSWQTWAKATKKRDSAERKHQGTPASSNSSSTTLGSAFGALASASSAAVTTTTAEPEKPSGEATRPDDCPPDVNALGRATWTFLHTTAAYYPPTPTPAQQSSMRALIAALGEFYPCTWCASDFRKRVAEHEPDVSGRRGLSRWFCERHNEVNEKLGKERFDCDKVMQRWKDGPPDGSCD